MPLYLKKQLLTNVPVKVEMVKRMQPKKETDFNTKEETGRMEFPYVFVISDGDRQELLHYAKEEEEDTLKLFQPGEAMIVTRREKEHKSGKRLPYHEWTAVGDIQAKTTPPLHKNTTARSMEKKADAYQDAQRVKDVQIGLQGYHQRILPAFLKLATDKGFDIKDEGTQIAAVNSSLSLAEKAYKALLDRAKEIAQS